MDEEVLPDGRRTMNSTPANNCPHICVHHRCMNNISKQEYFKQQKESNYKLNALLKTKSVRGANKMKKMKPIIKCNIK